MGYELLLKALAEIERLRLATDEGSLAKRADRMWKIARQAQRFEAPDGAAKADNGTKNYRDAPVVSSKEREDK